ncbi:MAG: tRNA preQ1(34) S-adenosylmethionine ribosyltransferase-isomerase QueA [Microthrixaceae bacterium]
MLTDEFDYPLDEAAIAASGAEPRDSARLMVDDPTRPPWEATNHTVADLADLLRPDDLVVFNDTRVLPARIRFRRSTGGVGEVLLLEPDERDPAERGWWEALVRPSSRLRPGVAERLDPSTTVEFGADLGRGRRLVRLLDVDGRALSGDALIERLELLGEMPLPPYLGSVVVEDPERYQTVFSRRPASAAAPTAGLHFTPGLLDRIAGRGIETVRVELVVGLGTFRPMTAATVEEHEMHAEHYRVAPLVWERILAARATGRRVVAVGTTVVRTLEAAATTGRTAGSTDLFVRRGHRWKVVDVLLTNFHLPRSSLLVMVDAFVGPRWRDLYLEAGRRGYRFLSFGDAMLLTRSDMLCD